MTKSSHITNDVSVREEIELYCLLFFTLNGIVKPNLDEAFI